MKKGRGERRKNFCTWRRGDDKSSGKASKTSHRTSMMMTTVERWWWWWWWCWRREEVKLEESKKERTIIASVTFCPFLHFFFSVSSLHSLTIPLLSFSSLTFPRHNQNSNDFFPNWRKLYTWLGMLKVKEEPNVIRGVQRGKEIITGWNTHRYSWCAMNKILAFFSTGSNNYMTWFFRDRKEWEWKL